MSAQQYGRPADVQLLDDIVGAILRRHGINAVGRADSPHYNGVWEIALGRAQKLQPTTLARIICARPDAYLYSVHCGTWLWKYESGPVLLQQIAATAMICRMRELLGEDCSTFPVLHEEMIPTQA